MTKETFPRTVTASELKLGDVVELFDGPFATATVKQIKDGLVHFHRPYSHGGDFTCTAGIICYTGLEEFSASVTSTSTYKLWRRGGQLQ